MIIYLSMKGPPEESFYEQQNGWASSLNLIFNLFARLSFATDCDKTANCNGTYKTNYIFFFYF